MSWFRRLFWTSPHPMLPPRPSAFRRNDPPWWKQPLVWAMIAAWLALLLLPFLV